MSEAFFPSNLNTRLRRLFRSHPTHVLMLFIPLIDSVSSFVFHLHTGNRPCVAVHGGTFDNL